MSFTFGLNWFNAIIYSLKSIFKKDNIISNGQNNTKARAVSYTIKEEGMLLENDDGVEVVQKLSNVPDIRSSYVIMEDDRNRLDDLDLVCYGLDLKVQTLESTYNNLIKDLEDAKEEFRSYLKVIKKLEKKSKELEKKSYKRFTPYNLRIKK